MLRKNYYTLKDIKKITGSTQRQLQYWEKKGYLSPKLGARNIRLYSPEDIEIIKKLVQAKKDGKTLGEAWGESKIQKSLTNPVFDELNSENLKKLEKLITKWVKSNHTLLEHLTQTALIEKEIPGYPYNLYKQDSINRLKQNQKKIKSLITRRERITTKISNFLEQLSGEDKIKLSAAEKQINTLDALVLYWAKNNPQYTQTELADKRDLFIKQLKQGQTYENIIREIKSSLS